MGNIKTQDLYLKDLQHYMSLRHLLSLLGKRVIPNYLYQHHYDLYKSWSFNSCRQTAFVVSYLLDLFYGSKQNRKIGLFEANFKDPYLGDAVHAFTYMGPSDKDSLGLLVDVSRISYPVLVERMPNLLDEGVILSNKMGYTITMEGMYEVDWKVLWSKEEYFTKLPYHEFAQLMLTELFSSHTV